MEEFILMGRSDQRLIGAIKSIKVGGMSCILLNRFSSISLLTVKCTPDVIEMNVMRIYSYCIKFFLTCVHLFIYYKIKDRVSKLMRDTSTIHSEQSKDKFKIRSILWLRFSDFFQIIWQNRVDSDKTSDLPSPHSIQWFLTLLHNSVHPFISFGTFVKSAPR